MRKRKQHKGEKGVDSIFERAGITAISAGLAGSGAAWITTPIDVVKTRIMLAASDASRPATAGGQPSHWLMHGAQGRRQTGFMVARDILATDGTRGLFRGALLRSCWTALGSGLYLGCYEGGRCYLERHREQGGVKEGDHLMQRDWKNVQVGIGRSRSQEVVKKSAWQDD